MITEAVLMKAASTVTSLVISSPTFRTAALKSVHREPMQVAIHASLRDALNQLGERYPKWTSSLFDGSFMELEAAPILAALLTRGRAVSATDLAVKFADHLNATGGHRISLIRSVEPAAAFFLDRFISSMKGQDVTKTFFDSQAIDESAAALFAIRESLGVGARTSGTIIDYLHWIRDRNYYLDPRGTLQTQRQVQLPLDDIYISLSASTERAFDEGQDAESKTDPALESSLEHLVGSKYRSVAVLGDPGGGKSTLLKFLALKYATLLLHGNLEITRSSPLPILVRLSEYSFQKASSLVSFLFTACHNNECPTRGLMDLFNNSLSNGACLVMFDGLDEVQSLRDRTEITKKIDDFIRRYRPLGNRVIVTSRKAGYFNAPLAEAEIEVRISTMRRPQVKEFLDRWCLAVEDAETPEISREARAVNAAREAASILHAFDSNRGVRTLAVNPLMLRVMALIHRTGAQLPQRRIELYKLATETLARTWRIAQGVPPSALAHELHVVRILSAVAYWMHLERPSGLVSHDEALRFLAAEWNAAQDKPFDPDDPPADALREASDFLDAVRIQTGLFVERAQGHYGFMHLTFEEYYCARRLTRSKRERADLIRKHKHNERFREPVLLALSFVALDYPEDAVDLLREAVLCIDESEAGSLDSSPLESHIGRDHLLALAAFAEDMFIDSRTLEMAIGQVCEWLRRNEGPGRFQEFHTSAMSMLGMLAQSSHESTARIARTALLGAWTHETTEAPALALYGAAVSNRDSSREYSSLTAAMLDDADGRAVAGICREFIGSLDDDAMFEALRRLATSKDAVSHAFQQEFLSDRNAPPLLTMIKTHVSKAGPNVRLVDLVLRHLDLRTQAETAAWAYQRGFVSGEALGAGLSLLMRSADARVASATAGPDAEEWTISAKILCACLDESALRSQLLSAMSVPEDDLVPTLLALLPINPQSVLDELRVQTVGTAWNETRAHIIREHGSNLLGILRAARAEEGELSHRVCQAIVSASVLPGWREAVAARLSNSAEIDVVETRNFLRKCVRPDRVSSFLATAKFEIADYSLFLRSVPSGFGGAFHKEVWAKSSQSPTSWLEIAEFSARAELADQTRRIIVARLKLREDDSKSQGALAICRSFLREPVVEVRERLAMFMANLTPELRHRALELFWHSKLTGLSTMPKDSRVVRVSAESESDCYRRLLNLAASLDDEWY